jgi:tetratricopeptide (TPR) repeat protein
MIATGTPILRSLPGGHLSTFLCVCLLAFAVCGSAFGQDAADVDTLLREGETLLDAEEFKAARDRFVRVLEADNENLKACLLLAKSHEFENQHPAAIPYLRRATKIDPTDPTIRRRLALALHRAEGVDAATDYLATCLDEFPGELDLRDTLAYYLFDSGRYAPAEKAYRELLELHPKTNFYARRLIECLAHQSKAQEAEMVHERMLRDIRESDLPEDEKESALERMEKGYNETLEACGLGDVAAERETRLLRGQPDDVEALNRLGDMYLNLGYGELALGAHLEAAYLAGTPERLMAKARLLATGNRELSAMRYFRAAYEHFPTSMEVLELVEPITKVRPVSVWSSEHFNPYDAAVHRRVETACRRVAESDGPPTLRIRAEMAAITHHYLPLPRSRDLCLEERALNAELLERPETPPDVREEIAKRIEEIDVQWLGKIPEPAPEEEKEEQP